MKPRAKIGWLRACLMGGILAVAAGCGGGGGGGGTAVETPTSPPGVLTAYASSANFGDVAVGNSSTVGMTFANTGAGPLTLQQNSVSGTGFTTNGVGQGITLNPGQYVTMAVSFAPSTTGVSSGTVSLTSTTTSAPISLQLSGKGVTATHSATVTWSPSPSLVVGYNVYRTPTSNEVWTKLNSDPVIATTYTDWNVQAGASYLYVVTSVNPENHESEFSDASVSTIPSP